MSPYTTVNLVNGNALTVLPLFHWDPLGPPVRFTLMHNSMTADTEAEPGIESGWGFDLGPGWTGTYSSTVQYKDEIEAILVEDDGNVWIYAYDNGDFIPPTGKHDHLVRNGDDTWTLTSPGQFQRHFGTDGLLIEEIDSSGNTLTITRAAYSTWERIVCIESAVAAGDCESPVRVEFEYDGAQLVAIHGVEGRSWTIHYDNDDRLIEVRDPRYSETEAGTEFGYETSGDKIQTVTDAAGAAWTYEYADGRLVLVTDPEVNSVSHSMTIEYPEEQVEDLWETIVHDRRSLEWVYHFDDDFLFVKRTDPLLNFVEFGYDGDYNVSSFTNELEHTWTAEYGEVGNLVSLTTERSGFA